ncbi:MAG: hypothetical protein ACRDY1_09700 [Acidimicrobiales bacterium]
MGKVHGRWAALGSVVLLVVLCARRPRLTALAVGRTDPFPQNGTLYDAGISYRLAFRAGAEPVAPVTASPGGCPHVDFPDGTRQATGGLWDALAAVLGLPPVRAGCDVFEGRDPGASVACGPAVSGAGS